jgi:hypothetical protein
MCLTALCDPIRVSPVHRRSPFRRLLGFVALATFALSFVSPLDAIQDLKPGDDAACGQVQLFSGPGGHHDIRVGAGTPAPVSQHCPYCHFLRAVSGASPVAVVALAAPATSVVPAITLSPRVTLSVVTHRPSRAPPAAA